MSKDLFEAREEVSAILTWLQANPNTCVYCGMNSECKDHLIPKPRSGRAIRYLVPTVPACHDCNNRINDAPIIYIFERASIVADSLRRKYRKQLEIKDRAEEEFGKFGRNLGEKIRIAQLNRQILRYRLRLLDAGGACMSVPGRRTPAAPHSVISPPRATQRPQRPRAAPRAPRPDDAPILPLPRAPLGQPNVRKKKKKPKPSLVIWDFKL